MLALGTLLAYVLEPHTQISVPFSAATGFSQALCLLYNLNLRRVDGESGSISSNPTSVYPMSKMGRSAFARSGTHAAGISVHQETVMHEDDVRYSHIPGEKLELISMLGALDCGRGEEDARRREHTTHQLFRIEFTEHRRL